MLYFAYDGSLNADWVSHYAIRLASHSPERRLELLHVDEARLSRAKLDARLAAIEAECAALAVELGVAVQPRRGRVADAILRHVPAGRDSYLVCGTRVRQRNLAFLAGTVSEELLGHARFNVLAVRVVQPGLLGMPRRMLLPVSGHPHGLSRWLPVLRLFGPDIRRIHVLLVREVDRARFHRMRESAVQSLLTEGEQYVRRAERELSVGLGQADFHLDSSVSVSDDVPKEIVIQANKHKSRLVFMGASERSLSERLFYGNPIEQVLRNAPCDVGICRGAE